MKTTITQMVQQAVASGSTFQQLKSIKWRLVTPDGRYVQPGLITKLGTKSTASVFDGRDNEHSKIKFFSALLQQPLSAELV